MGRRLRRRRGVLQCSDLPQPHVSLGVARHDNHREDLWRFNVRALPDLKRRIIPFFEANPLRTAKAGDFQKFTAVIRMMELGRHLTVDGLTEIALIAETMNNRKPSRFLESSEAIRQPTHIDA